MAISDKEQLRQMLIALLDSDLAQAELADRVRDRLYYIKALLGRVPAHQREHFLIMTALQEINEELQQLENL